MALRNLDRRKCNEHVDVTIRIAIFAIAMNTARKYTTALILLLIGSAQMFGAELVVKGKYQLRNIYVLNSTAEDGVSTCITGIEVNGQIAPDEIRDNAFEVDLSIYGLELGDDVTVTINHRENCTPKVLNPDALKPSPTFDIVDIGMKDKNTLQWTAVNEQGALTFIVQQKKWNKWVDVGTVEGKGTSNKNQYTAEVIPVAGENEFRVIQKGYDGSIRKSPVQYYTSEKKPVEYTYNKDSQSIKFSDTTMYELFNAYGQIVKTGQGESIDLEGLDNGEYILTYDNLVTEFVKN